MGTSTSSSGGKAGSPFDPEWLSGGGDGEGDALSDGSPAGGEGDPGGDSTDAAEGGDGANQNAQGGAGIAGNEPASADVAPDRRYAQARTRMSAYLGGAGRESLRGAAKSMVNKGMGGSKRAASTMRRSAQGAGRLGQFLAAARDGTDPTVTDWVQRVRAAGLSANDLFLEVVKEVLPDTGSIDEESLRNAAAEALGKLYEADPNVDVFALTDQQIEDVIGFTIANEVCNRLDLQLGQSYEKLKHSPQEVQRYRNDIKEWVHAEVQTVLEPLRGGQLDPQRLAREVLTSALKVFGE